ncbi:MAG TPA: hypothetical protein ENK74_05460, partial [Nitratifractor sp.]|nr:hypothetical protein [Nitratifractor sp.]
MKKNILSITLFITVFILLFLLQLFLQKGTVLELNTNSSTLHPKLYFKTFQDKYYSEKSSVESHINRVGHRKYYFDLTNFEKLRYVRIDPDTLPVNATIYSIAIIDRGWFHTSYNLLNLEKLRAANQIEIVKRTQRSVSFKAAGGDPFFEAPVDLKYLYTKRDYHIEPLLIALIGTLIVVFLYNIYRNYEHSQVLYAKLILYTLFFSFTIFKVDYYKEHVHFGYPPDEYAHLSYVEYVHNNHAVLPNFHEMKMFNDKSRYNYLSHPPLYYEILNLVYNDKIRVKDNFVAFRDLSSLLFLLAFALILYIAFSAKLSILGDFVFLSIVTAVPMFAYGGASISNDTLSILAVAIFSLGFMRLLKREYSFSTYLLLAIGILLAYFSK